MFDVSIRCTYARCVLGSEECGGVDLACEEPWDTCREESGSLINENSRKGAQSRRLNSTTTDGAASVVRAVIEIYGKTESSNHLLQSRTRIEYSRR